MNIPIVSSLVDTTVNVASTVVATGTDVVVKVATALGNVVKKYSSITEASKETNIILSGISKCCKKLLKTSGGYIWRYYNESIKP